MEIHYFENKINKPTEEDTRTFEQLEDSMDYEFIRTLDRDTMVHGKDYLCTGCHYDENKIAVLLYGYNGDIDNEYITRHIVSSKVEKHNGFQILYAESDKRIYDAKETENTWLVPFIGQIASEWEGCLKDSDGNPKYDEKGTVVLKYLYDYVWMVVRKDEIIPYDFITNEWQKITIEENDFYIKWVNQ